MSDTSQGQLAFVKETVPGTPPATPAFSVIDFMSEDLALTSNNVRSAAVTSQRVVKGNRRAGKEVGGGVSLELYKAPEIDAILASLMGSPFAGSPLTAIAGGNVVDLYTFERRITATNFRRFSGGRVSSAEFTITPEANVQTRLTLMGYTETSGVAPISGATYAPAGTAGKLTALDVLPIVLSNGITSSLDFSQLQFTVNNQARVNKRLGPATVRSIGVGQALVTGTMGIYIDDTSVNDAFLADTHFNMDVPLQLAGSGYGFSFKNVALIGYADPNTGNNAEFMGNVQFEATLDLTYGSSFGISKTS